MKKSKEARSSRMELLPREIIISILSKLPVSSFMQCKLVCKYWSLLVQDDHLFCKHPGLFLQSYYPIKNQLYFARQSIIYQISLPLALPEFNLVGSSNSFLCFNNSQDISSIYVYNFCTGVYIVLPEPRKYDEEISTLGFGMDPITKQHKVVRIVCYKSPRNPLVTLGKCLSVGIGKGSGNIFKIWVMKEYGVVESWILAYSFGFDVPQNYPLFVRVLGLLNNGEILLEYESRRLISYDPNLNAFTPYELTNNLSFVFVTVVHMGCHWLG
ncbi:hypothetical protein ACFE04_001217 [Oxalis oulophora]